MTLPIVAATPCTYQLHIKVATSIRVTVGKLGRYDFPAGRYIYTGSAKRNLDTRIARHKRPDKKLRWHIDYLLTHPQVGITKVTRSTEPECQLNRALHGCIVVKGFGSSDCKAGCGSHLKRITS